MGGAAGPFDYGWQRSYARSAYMDTLQIALRIIHIGSAIVWVGSALFLHFFIEPTVRALGPPGGAFMAHMVEKRKVPVVIAFAAVLTIAAGIVLYIRDSDGFDPDWITSSVGLSFTVGAVAAISAFFLGLIFVRPRVVRLGALAAAMGSGEPSPQNVAELGALRKRLHSLSLLNLALLAIATIAMASASYLYAARSGARR